MWWFKVEVILILGRLRQENHHEFKANLAYKMRNCLKI